MKDVPPSRPYRVEGERSPIEVGPSEFLYRTGDGRSGGLMSGRTFLLLVVGVVIATGLALTARPDLGNERLVNTMVPVTVGAVLLLASTGFFKRFASRRDSRAVATGSVSGLLLRIDQGELLIAKTDAPRSPVLRAGLRELRDVRLDTKAIRKVASTVEGAGQFMTHQVGPELDVARIQLHIEGRERPIPLTEAFKPHMEAVEWVGKIRTFLRAHDWLPEDERVRCTMPSSADDDDLEDEYENEQGEKRAGRVRFP